MKQYCGAEGKLWSNLGQTKLDQKKKCLCTALILYEYLNSTECTLFSDVEQFQLFEQSNFKSVIAVFKHSKSCPDRLMNFFSTSSQTNLCWCSTKSSSKSLMLFKSLIHHYELGKNTKDIWANIKRDFLLTRRYKIYTTVRWPTQKFLSENHICS